MWQGKKIENATVCLLICVRLIEILMIWDQAILLFNFAKYSPPPPKSVALFL